MKPHATRAELQAFWHDRIAWGVIWGLKVALVLGGFAVLLFLLDRPRSFPERGTSLQEFLIVYALSGIAGGLLVGVARPLLRYQVGSAVAGFLAGACMGGAFAAFDHQLSRSLWDLGLPGVFGLTGLMAGLSFYRKAKRSGKSDPRSMRVLDSRRADVTGGDGNAAGSRRTRPNG